MKFNIHKKEWEGYLYENDTGKNIVGHSKLKFFWGYDKHKGPLTKMKTVTFS